MLEKPEKITKREQLIPWFLPIFSLITLTVIGLFLHYNISWFKDSVDSLELEKRIKDSDRLEIYHLHLGTIKRSVGLFSGFAVMFLGLGFSLYSLKKITNINLESTNFKLSLASASPGIIATLLGGIIIILTIYSKDTFVTTLPKNTITKKSPESIDLPSSYILKKYLHKGNLEDTLCHITDDTEDFFNILAEDKILPEVTKYIEDNYGYDQELFRKKKQDLYYLLCNDSN